MTFQRIYPKSLKPTIVPTLKQHQAWEYLKDPATMFVVFGGGAGGGKSWLGCEWLLTNCYFYPQSKWFIGREELKRLMTSTFITWSKVCAHHKIPKSDWDLNQKYNYIEFANGSRIDLLDLKYLPSDPLYERFGSLEYTGGWIEEAGEIDFGAFDVLKSRINRHLNDKYNLQGKMLLTCNPTKRWLYSTVYKPFRAGKLSLYYAFIQSLWKDNPHTAEKYGEMLKQIKDEAQKQRLMYGNWEYDDDPRRLIEFDAICDLFTNKVPTGEKYLTIDVARFGADKAVIMRWEGWQVKQIIAIPTCTVTRLQAEAENICNTHFIPRSHVIADEDGVGGGFVDNFKCKGFVNNSSAIQPYEAAYDKTKALNYSNLKTQCYFLLAEKINNHEMGIDDHAFEEYIKEELEQVKIENEVIEGKIKLVSKEEIKENIGRSPDFADSLMMRAYFDLKKPTVASDNYESAALSYINSVERPSNRSMIGVDYKEYQPQTIDLLHNDRN